MRHQVGVGNQHSRRIGVSLENADRLAGLHQQAFIFLECFEGAQDLVEALPVPRRAPDTTVDHQFLRSFGNIGVEIILNHSIRRLGQPALAGQFGTARCAYDARVVQSCV